MNFDYKVLDNFIPITYQNLLLEMFETSVAQWAYLPSLAGLDQNDLDPANNKIVPTMGLTQKVYFENTPINKNWPITAPLLWFLEHRTGAVVQEIDRVTANLMVPVGNNDPSTYNEPHIDHPESHYLSMIYYLEDSDGETRIFNNKCNDGFYDLELIHSQPPKKGTAMIFPSTQFHASSSPIHSPSRRILNFVFSIENPHEM
jgi:hypothetical protein|tara:strand:- start:235 stop:840 length:606 start_codon:yes stop_codon:yes gene_type:complete